MGYDVVSRALIHEETATRAPKTGPATKVAEQQAHISGKLNPLVDPAGYGGIRRSLIRLDQRPDGLWVVTVGTPATVEIRVDSTTSMGGEMDVALKVLPDLVECCQNVLPGRDLQLAIGTFGDVCDRFVMCRPQFEMRAERLVEQLTLMVPVRGGGDPPEDPHYGLFGAVYLTAAYINRIELKRYDFTVTDAAAHEGLDVRQLYRIYGEDVFEKVAENGHQLDRHNLPDNRELVRLLLTQAHAFVLQVGNERWTNSYWSELYGPERVIKLPATEYAPQIQAAIIGLTEGTLGLGDVGSFLQKGGLDQRHVEPTVRQLVNIPIGAQAALPNYSRQPVKGDLFRDRSDLWPLSAEEVAALGDGSAAIEDTGSEQLGGAWL